MTPWTVAKWAFGVHDPLRRRRVRAAARRLVPGVAWDGENLSGDDIARLSLLRLLFIQAEARRAVRHRESEAAALLGRTSIETAITGLYCLASPEAVAQFNGSSGKALKNLLGDLATDGLGLDLSSIVTEAFGKEKVPSPLGMVDVLVKVRGRAGVEDLYTRYYAPLSALYAHASPISLLRHVHPKTAKTRDRPYKTWGRRSPAHAADAMVAVLASALAGPDHPDRPLFDEYAEAHWRLVWTPLFYVARGLSLTRLHWDAVPPLVKLTLRLRKAVANGQTLTPEDAEAIDTALGRALGGHDESQAFQALREGLKQSLLAPPTS